MSERQSNDFIPFNQSTPVQSGHQRFNQNRRNNFNQQNRSFAGFSGSSNGGFENRWRNNPRNNSMNTNRNSFHENFKNNDSCDAYIHPDMLKDPWANLRPVYIPQGN